jgi:hypothetical protein
LFWDEFDLLLMVTVGVRLLMRLPKPNGRLFFPRAVLGWIALSVFASTAIGLWPLSAPDANAFSSYLSNYNALRLAKGYAWGIVLIWLICRDLDANRDIASRLCLGFALGLVGITATVVAERLILAWPLGLSTAYRTSGFVSAMHVGGAYIEAILVALLPFGLAQVFQAPDRTRALLWGAALLAGTIALVTTQTRSAVAAWAISMLTFVLLAYRRSRGATPLTYSFSKQSLTAGVLLALSLLAAGAHFTSLRERWATIDSDLSVRLEHWRTLAGLFRPSALHAAAGMGLGSLPREYYIARVHEESLPSIYLNLDRATHEPYLRLTGGRGLFLDQRISATGGEMLHLSARIRSSSRAHLGVGLCEKSFLESVRCVWEQLPTSEEWRNIGINLTLPPTTNLAEAIRPRALSLHNGTAGKAIDVAFVSLVGNNGELLRNGQFGDGLDRWFFTSDQHLAWHAKNLLLQVCFEQGFMGILAWIAMAWAIFASTAKARCSCAVQAAAVAAVLGFGVLGLFDSVIDTPRLALLFLLVCGVCLVGCRQTEQRPTTPPSRVE